MLGHRLDLSATKGVAIREGNEMVTIAKQVEEQYGAKIKALETHSLLHLYRQEYPDGRSATVENFGGKRVFDAVQALVSAELKVRGHGLPLVSAAFLICNH